MCGHHLPQRGFVAVFPSSMSPTAPQSSSSREISVPRTSVYLLCASCLSVINTWKQEGFFHVPKPIFTSLGVSAAPRRQFRKREK